MSGRTATASAGSVATDYPAGSIVARQYGKLPPALRCLHRADQRRGRRLPAVPGRRDNDDARPHALRDDDVRLGHRSEHRRHEREPRRPHALHRDVDVLPQLEHRRRLQLLGRPVQLQRSGRGHGRRRSQSRRAAVGGTPRRLPVAARPHVAGEEQRRGLERRPRLAAVRRDADGRDVRGRAVLPLERPGRPAADRQLRPGPVPQRVHHPAHRRRAQPRPRDHAFGMRIAPRRRAPGRRPASAPSPSRSRPRPPSTTTASRARRRRRSRRTSSASPSRASSTARRP